MQIGKAYLFKMTNLPGEPWFIYYLISKQPGYAGPHQTEPPSFTFSSIPPGGSQVQAEHFHYIDRAFAKDFKAGFIKETP